MNKNTNLKIKNTNSQILDNFVFSVLCATIFTACLCHWMLNLNYRFQNENQQGPIVDFRWVFWIGAIVSIYYIVKRKEIKFDFALCALIQALILVGVHDYLYEQYVPVCYTWILPIAYIVGKNVAGYYRDDISKVFILIIVLAVAMLSISSLDYFNKYLIAYPEKYAWPDFFTGEYTPKTTYALGTVLYIGMAGLIYLGNGIKKAIKIIYTIVMIIVQFFALRVESRETPCMLLMTLVLAFAIKYFNECKKISKSIFLKVFFGIMLMVFITVIVFGFNLFGIGTIYSKSFFGRDGGLLRNVRISMDINAIKYMMKYPLEDWQRLYGLPRGHSMMLEYARNYGLTVFVLLVLFQILILMRLFIVLKSNIDLNIKLLLLSYICLWVYFILEPNGHAYRYFWMSGLIICGVISNKYCDNISKDMT